MIYVLALNWQQFTYWCRHVADPPIPPRSRDIHPILTDQWDAADMVRGHRYDSGSDVLVAYGQEYMGRAYRYGLAEELGRAGFPA